MSTYLQCTCQCQRWNSQSWTDRVYAHFMPKHLRTAVKRFGFLSLSFDASNALRWLWFPTTFLTYFRFHTHSHLARTHATHQTMLEKRNGSKHQKLSTKCCSSMCVSPLAIPIPDLAFNARFKAWAFQITKEISNKNTKGILPVIKWIRILNN